MKRLGDLRQAARAVAIETERGFVEQNDAAALREDPRKRDAPALTAAQMKRRAFDERLRVESDLVQRAAHAFFDLGRGHPRSGEAVTHFLGDGLGEELALGKLEHQTGENR